MFGLPFMRNIHIVIIFLLIGLSSFAQEDSLKKIEGTWFINMTNFKMWLTGKKTNATFNYWIETRKGVVGLKDHVIYTQRKKSKAYKGFDKPLNSKATSFVWKGDGLLFFIKTKWQVIYQNSEYAIVHYDKTFATKAGCDVISRKRNLDDATINSIRIKLKELGIVDTLTVIFESL